jgi:hypothetical protein
MKKLVRLTKQNNKPDKRFKHFLSNKQIKWFTKNYPSLGPKKCSDKMGVILSYIIHLATKLGLKVSKKRKSSVSRRNAYKQFKTLRKERLKMSKNMIVNSPSMAYSLGFLWGDGYLSKANTKTNLYYIQLEILKEDLEQIQKFLNSLGKWKGYERNRNDKPTFCAGTYDPVLGLFLKNHNYDKKSFVDPSKILSVIPENLKHYWWRGYVDADGCFYVRKNKNKCNENHGTFIICGNIKQKWNSLKILLDKLNINYKIEKETTKRGKCSRIAIYNKNGIRSFGNYLYKNSKKICLKRKYDKFSLISGFKSN